MNEAETRAEHIDPALKAAGWGVVEGSRIRREYPITLGRLEGHGRRGKPLTADYVLVYRNTKLAVIEAKAWDEAADRRRGAGEELRRQAGRPLRLRHQRPGHLRHRHADGHGGRAAALPDAGRTLEPDLRRSRTPGATASPPCRSRTRAATSRAATTRTSPSSGCWRPSPPDRQRILLTLATGTGKTFIAFQIAWKLFHSRWNLSREPTRRPRILFLADRNILADQAYNAFSAFPEDALVRIEPEDIRKKGKVPKNGSLFFTIFQTFMSGPPKDGKPSPYFGEYPPDFFDFIVIDECHRGGANDESNWRGILEYFAPAVQLGLTATPKRKDNVDTYAYFGEPVYIYSLKEGINDGFLTPFKVKQISTTLDEYVYTPDDTADRGRGRSRASATTRSDFNKIIEIKEREAHRVKLFMEQIDQREKTLVFCATQDHALAVRDLINQMKTSSDPNYCQRVTANDGALGEQHLRDFQDNEKTIPTILTTSQKLSTGVDARNIRNIVLMRPINSMIEFKQIIGRGTRLYDGKDYFTIYDFVKAHHHFSDPEWDGEPMEPETEAAGRRDADSRPTEPSGAEDAGRSAAARKQDQGEAGRRQGAHHPAHDGDDASGIPTARRCRRSSSWKCCSASCPSSSRTRPSCAPSGARPTRGRSCCRDWPRRASAASSWPRCRRSSTPRRATCSTCWPTWPTPCRRSPARSAPRRRRSRSAPTSTASSRPSSTSCCRTT